jgi:hypothetical protein
MQQQFSLCMQLMSSETEHLTAQNNNVFVFETLSFLITPLETKIGSFKYHF